MLSATAWEPDLVRLVATAARRFKHPEKQLEKTFCGECGEVVFGTNRLGMRVVPNALLARVNEGTLDVSMAPTMHLYYRQRVVDVLDDLPKYLDGWDGPTCAPE